MIGWAAVFISLCRLSRLFGCEILSLYPDLPQVARGYRLGLLRRMSISCFLFQQLLDITVIFSFFPVPGPFRSLFRSGPLGSAACGADGRPCCTNHRQTLSLSKGRFGLPEVLVIAI
jgi:hypothetical protein